MLEVRRAYQVYLYVVCFVGLVTLVVATALLLFGVVRAAVPGESIGHFGAPPGAVPADEELRLLRREGLVQVAENAVLVLSAGVVFTVHWRRAGRLRQELEAASEAPGRRG